MGNNISLDHIYAPSDDVVARVIEGEIILVPIATGIGDIEDALFTLNETGHDIWRRLDGIHSLCEIAAMLAAEYETEPGAIEDDVVGLVTELVLRRMLVRK